ncbi:Peptidyl-tRNA hydrolase [hydrothermal vent metagenome]|uniref:peptidyl-tRNA hydrolase n=1 Tax=hydrothermal vent metagenome TaxID=652676 RepID=A0A3B1D9W5_9ZZZZ
MWVIVGLGNPGRKYSGTRHNIGFRVIDSLSERLRIVFTEKEKYLKGEGLYKDNSLILVKPLTYMNLSGVAVREVIRMRNCPPERLIVVHDDLALPVGRIKIRERGSSGGHRGIQSIIESTGTNEFIRVKIGIGRSPEIPAEVYVLKKFTPQEREIINEAVDSASDAVLSIIDKGISRAMTGYNR